MSVETTGTRATRILGVICLTATAAVALLALALTPEDVIQGDSVRIMYVHVPSAWMAYVSFFVTFVGSVAYLWKRTRSEAWDRIAGASAEIGVLFTALALVTGMAWGKLTWGVYWTWDARLTTTALLFVLFLGYLTLRRLPAAPEVRARRSAIAGIVAFVDVPIVHQSVEWWRTLHQDATVLRRDLDAQIEGLMLFTLFAAMITMTLVYVWMVIHRMRVAVLEDAIERRGLELAIAERRDEIAPLVEGALS